MSGTDNIMLEKDSIRKPLNGLSPTLLDRIIYKFNGNVKDVNNKKEKIIFIIENDFDKIIGYVDFYKEISHYVNRNEFKKRLYPLLKDKNLIDKYSKKTFDIIIICALEDVKIDSLYEAYRLTKIEHYEKKDKYIIQLSKKSNNIEIKKDISQFVYEWNKNNLNKIKIEIKEKDGRLDVNLFKETGSRFIAQFSNRTNVDVITKTRINPVVQNYFDLYQEESKWLAVSSFKLDNDVLSKKLLEFMFSQNVKIEKDIKDGIMRIEKSIKKSKNCKDLLNNIVSIKSDTITKINTSNIEQDKKSQMLAKADTISLCGILAKNRSVLKIDKYDLVGDIEYINKNNKIIIDSINQILSSSEDYEIKIKIGNKPIGILNGEIKPPSGILSDIELDVLNYIFV
jgi:hypothetical protein